MLSKCVHINVDVIPGTCNSVISARTLIHRVIIGPNTKLSEDDTGYITFT